MKKNIGSILLIFSAFFCFTGVGLFWSDKIDQEKLKSGIDVISIIILKSIQLLEAEKKDNNTDD